MPRFSIEIDTSKLESGVSTAVTVLKKVGDTAGIMSA